MLLVGAVAMVVQALFRRHIQEQFTAITISIGVAGFVPNGHADPSHLLRRADAALYRAKSGGRNQVEGDADAPPR